MSKKCTELHFNWFYTSGPDEGEGWETAKVGVRGVVKINKIQTQIHNYFTIIMNDGSEQEVYNPNRAFYEECE